MTLLIFFFAFGPYLRWLLLDELDLLELLRDELRWLLLERLRPLLLLCEPDLRRPPLLDELDFRRLELDFRAVAICF